MSYSRKQPQQEQNDLLDAIINNEKDTFAKTASVNVFKDTHPKQKQSLLLRFKRTYWVFRGQPNNAKNKDSYYKDERPFSQRAKDFFKGMLPSNLKQVIKVRKKSKQGIFSLLLGVPSHLVYATVPMIGGLAAVAGTVLCLGILRAILPNKDKKQGPLAIALKAITSPLWITGLLVGGALVIGGAAVYAAAKAALYPVNWLVQKAVVPLVSMVATALVAPIVLLVHKILSPKKPKQLIEFGGEEQFNNTHSELNESMKQKSRTQQPTQTYGQKSQLEGSQHSEDEQYEEDANQYASQYHVPQYGNPYVQPVLSTNVPQNGKSQSQPVLLSAPQNTYYTQPPVYSNPSMTMYSQQPPRQQNSQGVDPLLTTSYQSHGMGRGQK